MAGYFRCDAAAIGGVYDTYTVRDGQNRIWKVVRDASITSENERGASADDDYRVELVSPICRYEDIPTVQELVRQLRHAGARVNDSCGIHVHVDASTHTPQTLRNVVNIMAAKEDILYRALQIYVDRERYCKKSRSPLSG